MLSQASRNLAAGVFVVGMLLIGFGFLIYVLRDLFAILFAIIFCAAGIGCLGTAVKIFFSLRRFNKSTFDESKSYDSTRKNVRIHIEENYDAQA
jgi:hypothetical protein